MHIQVNAQWLVSEGVQTVGVETMEGIKKRFMKVSFSRNKEKPAMVITESTFTISRLELNPTNQLDSNVPLT
jgi:hypothetical protein